MDRTYIAIDLKSFYASVECMDRGLDPMTTNLVVADLSRTEKTICLAVSPSLKRHGVPGRPRLFEVVEKVGIANALRREKAPGHKFTDKSADDTALRVHPEYAIDYLVAPPRMALYMEISAKIYDVYLRYIAPEDIHPYSIDEVFIDATSYLKTYRLTARELTMRMIREVLEATGITATAGIGENLYLAKVAMDIVAKHIDADENGVRIAELTEMDYRRLLWDHEPITDFWRVGPGYAKRLASQGLTTMGDIARCSLGGPGAYHNQELLYKLFGVNAELLIDHAWGWEPCTMQDIKSYKSESHSVGCGQVLQCPYDWEKAKLVVREMAEGLVLDLVDKGLVTNLMVLNVGYDIENLSGGRPYAGPVTQDRYGRSVPKAAHGSQRLGRYTSSTKEIVEAVMELFDRIVARDLLIRRMDIAACQVIAESDAPPLPEAEQLDLFTDYARRDRERQEESAARDKERRMQTAMLAIKKKYGKNAILKGMDLEEGATARERNAQIGGHKA